MRYFLIAVIGVAILVLASDGQDRSGKAAQLQGGNGFGMTYKFALRQKVATYGAENWIVIADGSFPAFVNSSIEYAHTSDPQLDVVKTVLDMVNTRSSLRADVYQCSELPFIAEKDADGVTEYRNDFKKMLGDVKPQSWLHNDLMNSLVRESQKYQVLVIKTHQKLPYSSVFIRLDRGAWNADAEKRLRDAMKK